jgi:hypothetical protein
MNDDYIISIDDTKFISTEFEFDIKMNRFKCNVVNSINKYPFIFYSLKSYIARFIIYDIWNILPEKGNIIRTNPLISHEKNNNMLIALYIDTSGYKHLQSVGIDNWIKRFIDGQLLPYNVDDIDYIMYTDNIDIYKKLLKCKRYNVYHNNSIRNLWLNILKNYLVNYKYILWINGNILIDSIHMLYDLLMSDVSIITPHIVGKNNTTKSKCVDGISQFIIRRKVLGIWTVPHIQDVILMRNDSFNNLYETMLKYDFNNSTSFEKYICNCLMVCGYNMWYINTRLYGKDNRF